MLLKKVIEIWQGWRLIEGGEKIENFFLLVYQFTLPVNYDFFEAASDAGVRCKWLLNCVGASLSDPHSATSPFQITLICRQSGE